MFLKKILSRNIFSGSRVRHLVRYNLASYTSPRASQLQQARIATGQGVGVVVSSNANCRSLTISEKYMHCTMNKAVTF